MLTAPCKRVGLPHCTSHLKWRYSLQVCWPNTTQNKKRHLMQFRKNALYRKIIYHADYIYSSMQRSVVFLKLSIIWLKAMPQDICLQQSAVKLHTMFCICSSIWYLRYFLFDFSPFIFSFFIARFLTLLCKMVTFTVKEIQNTFLLFNYSS